MHVRSRRLLNDGALALLAHKARGDADQLGLLDRKVCTSKFTKGLCEIMSVLGLLGPDVRGALRGLLGTFDKDLGVVAEVVDRAAVTGRLVVVLRVRSVEPVGESTGS